MSITPLRYVETDTELPLQVAVPPEITAAVVGAEVYPEPELIMVNAEPPEIGG